MTAPTSHAGQAIKLLRLLLSDGLAARFWSKVTKSDEGCWIWSGSRNPKGYGQLAYRHYPLLAHRVSYAIHYDDPREMCVLHRCDNPACVRPDHLFLGTVADNNLDMNAKGRARGGRLPGEASPNARLTDDIVREIRSRFVPGKRGDGTRAARELGVSEQTIHRVLRRKSWTHL